MNYIRKLLSSLMRLIAREHGAWTILGEHRRED